MWGVGGCELRQIPGSKVVGRKRLVVTKRRLEVGRVKKAG